MLNYPAPRMCSRKEMQYSILGGGSPSFLYSLSLFLLFLCDYDKIEYYLKNDFNHFFPFLFFRNLIIR